MGRINRRTGVLLAAIVVVAVLIVTVVVIGVLRNAEDADVMTLQPEVKPEASSEHGIQIIQVEKEVSVETLEEGIRDMGLLITSEYYFTDAVSQTKVKTLFNLTLGFTESSYLATYDGSVTAGIDFSAAAVELDRDERVITVRMPKAAIQNVDIDPASFVLYSEKNGLGNPLSVSDFNGSLVELEDKARIKAVERGILEEADENARRITETFIGGFLDLRDYNILWDCE